MNIKEEVLVKVRCLYIFPKSTLDKFIDKIEGYDDEQLKIIDKKLDLILKKLGELTIKLLNDKKTIV